MSIQSDNRYFRTTNLYTACWLYAKGFELANIDKTADPKRAQFVFPNSPELEAAVHIFLYSLDSSPELLINARKLFTSMKQLKNGLYQDIFKGI